MSTSGATSKAGRKRTPDHAKRREDEQEASSQEEEDEKLRMTLENLAGVGAILEHVYTRQEQFEADLFAIHLCRNAGFDVENCLDGLRRRASPRMPVCRRNVPRGKAFRQSNPRSGANLGRNRSRWPIIRPLSTACGDWAGLELTA